jgi:hypothetical protein
MPRSLNVGSARRAHLLAQLERYFSLCCCYVCLSSWQTINDFVCLFVCFQQKSDCAWLERHGLCGINCFRVTTLDWFFVFDKKKKIYQIYRLQYVGWHSCRECVGRRTLQQVTHQTIAPTCYYCYLFLDVNV